MQKVYGYTENKGLVEVQPVARRITRTKTYTINQTINGVTAKFAIPVYHVENGVEYSPVSVLGITIDGSDMIALRSYDLVNTSSDEYLWVEVTNVSRIVEQIASIKSITCRLIYEQAQ